MIKSYNNISEWVGDSLPTTESTIGLILDTNTSVNHGINVEVKYPKYADAVYVDGNGNTKFIVGETLDRALLPSDYIPVGVVFYTLGKEVKILGLNDIGSLKASEVWRCSVTLGANALTDTECSAVIKYSIDGTNAEEKTFTFTATTKQEIVDQFNAWVVENDPLDRRSYMYLDKDDTIQWVVINYINSYPHSDTFTGDLTVNSNTRNVATEIPVDSRCFCEYGTDILYVTMNAGAIKRWGGRVPTSATNMSTRNTQVSENDFYNSEYCKDLKDVCGDYDNYLKLTSYKPKNKGVNAWYNKGYENTYLLAKGTYINKEGVETLMYPAYYKTAEYSPAKLENHNIFGKGRWYVPTVEELYYLMKDITVGSKKPDNSGNIGTGVVDINYWDNLNKTLYAMGGTVRTNNAYRWTSVRCSSSSMWGCISYGCLDTGSFCSSRRVEGVLSLLII